MPQPPPRLYAESALLRRHWVYLGRQQGASTREPGDQPCKDTPTPSGVTG